MVVVGLAEEVRHEGAEVRLEAVGEVAVEVAADLAEAVLVEVGDEADSAGEVDSKLGKIYPTQTRTLPRPFCFPFLRHVEGSILALSLPYPLS